MAERPADAAANPDAVAAAAAAAAAAAVAGTAEAAEATDTITATLILNFQQIELTLRCLANLRSFPYPGNRILILDNGSNPQDLERLQAATAGHGDVELRPLHGNLGYCAAHNVGLAWAAGIGARYVLFLNNDVTLTEPVLPVLVAALENDPRIAGVMPTVLDASGRVWSQGADIRFGPNLTGLRGLGRAPAPRQTGPFAVGYLPGACVLYRLASLDEVGGLDPSYFMYFEDAHLGALLRSAGHRLLWLPWLRVTHAPSQSSGGGRSPLRKYLMAANSVRYLRAHPRPALWASLFLFDGLGLPFAFLASGWRAGWAKACGLVAGLRGHPVTEADVRRWLRT